MAQMTGNKRGISGYFCFEITPCSSPPLYFPKLQRVIFSYAVRVLLKTCTGEGLTTNTLDIQILMNAGFVHIFFDTRLAICEYSNV